MIVRRKDKFGVVVYDPATQGKKWIGTYPTEEVALREEARAQAAMKSKRKAETCDAFARRWPTDYPRPARATNVSREYALKPFIRRFEGMPLAGLERPEARIWALAQPISYTDALRVMFTDAINDGLHPGPNPFANLRRPRSRGRRDIDALTYEQIHDLADCAVTVRGEFGRCVLRPLIIFQAFVMTRPAELYFVERSDVHDGFVYVLQSDDGARSPKAPKNGNKRKVVLPRPAAEAIKDVPPRLDVPWLFYTVTGKQLNKSNLYPYWCEIRAAYKRPDLDFYELRHAGASVLTNDLEIDSEFTAIEMGHRDGGRRVRTLYGHRNERLAHDAVRDAYEARFQKARSPEQRSPDARPHDTPNGYPALQDDRLPA